MARPPKNPDIPSRRGVSASCIALPYGKASPWPRLIDFLAERLAAVDREGWMRRMAQGEVLSDAGQPLPPHAPFVPGTRVYYYRELDDEPPVPFLETVLFQDEHLLVVDKPHFLPVTPGGRYVQQSLLVRLKNRLGIDALSPIHRIDRETAGVVVFSVVPKERGSYQSMFRERSVHKTYEAIAPHSPSLQSPVVRRSRIEEAHDAFFRMNETDGEPNSETRIALLETQGVWGRYRLEPVTGKRHQLRVHMNAMGLPIAGDQFYPRVLRGPQESEDFTNPLRLLARAIRFTDPVTNEPRHFESQLKLGWPT
ncbi:pseudouridine synthase [Hydrogenophaga laconesensis]|uniref:tRNA pseudouridine32 synthase/23S rRNA pseudouridine746 synthase n=1 Tax=Hydrogenophaga laconesensis TaxID=1805971 RepID=A0ABU1V5Y3_9BURK|nr:pseudouridine synthase [Hydrogenophaga laconesensis]MDR7092753.1 tRNA pseudouridine32 synthase/23S rRNA pseudouridine746 synthase [Hydrogenophaga laconesensis]